MLKPQQLFLVREPVDMRRGIDALTQHLEGLNLRWQDEAAFVFCNKARSRLKVLRWDRHGVWLCTRRLHRAHFVWPKQGERSWVMTPAQFDWLIRGIHWQQVEGDDLSGWQS
ncbi:IS66 family insertion sequence element accessory protein TnpB [Photorhabdus sp. CRCIA-P01]|uniref:IS66 family insertion sequence element accessory protein TnpB n=1 Tax=Photorhabdus sp. CRCIA-P01 TaxID=2019570 RepID=UPI000E59A2CB|nr:IS66 family insertion sequence element accessory protein TnpB [Photorhabdus sp. CRCIA-P01]